MCGEEWWEERCICLNPNPNPDILFVSRTDGESAPLRNQGGLTTAMQFTQQKAPILAKELKKTDGVTRIHSRVETYVRARMEELINVVVGGLSDGGKSPPIARQVRRRLTSR